MRWCGCWRAERGAQEPAALDELRQRGISGEERLERLAQVLDGDARAPGVLVEAELAQRQTSTFCWRVVNVNLVGIAASRVTRRTLSAGR